jgi:hypothetical protein
VLLGISAAATYAIYQALAARRPDTGGLTFEPQPFPSLPRPVPKAAAPSPAPRTAPGTAAAAAQAEPWLEADEGSCPVSHPVKAKLASGIFHVPGGQSYERTKADRCYVDAPAAEADGLRPAKR